MKRIQILLFFTLLTSLDVFGQKPPDDNKVFKNGPQDTAQLNGSPEAKKAIDALVDSMEYYNKGFVHKEFEIETVFNYKDGLVKKVKKENFEVKQIKGQMHKRVVGSKKDFARPKAEVELELNADFFGRFYFTKLSSGKDANGREFVTYKFEPRKDLESVEKYNRKDADKGVNTLTGLYEVWSDDLTTKRMTFELPKPVKWLAGAFQLEKMTGSAEFVSVNGRSEPRRFQIRYRYWVLVLKPNKEAEKIIEYSDYQPIKK